MRVIARSGWVVAGGMGLLLLAALAGVVSGGPLDPPGTPAPTMKTLHDVEPRIALSPDGPTDSFVISEAGSYYLTSGFTAPPDGNGVTINAAHVTLDLTGFEIVSGGCPGNVGSGIELTTNAKSATIRNGSVRGFCTAGVSAPVFQNGGILIEGIHALYNPGYGIYAYSGVLKECVALGNGLEGIKGGFLIVSDCMASENGGAGFDLADSTLLNCTAAYNSNWGIRSARATVNGCHTSYNRAGGIDVRGGGLITGNWLEEFETGSFAIRSSSTASGGTRIEGNTVQTGENGIVINSSNNMVVGNYVHTTDAVLPAFSIIPENIRGPILIGFQAPITSTNPWANFAIVTPP